MASSLLGAVENATRVQGLVTNPANNTTKDLVRLKGPGLFISAELTKQGGNTDITFVEMYIDGRDVVSTSIAGLFNMGLTSHNSYGVQAFRSGAGLETVCIGFPVPLTFHKEFLLRVVVKETGVVQILSNVICTVEQKDKAVAAKKK